LYILIKSGWCLFSLKYICVNLVSHSSSFFFRLTLSLVLVLNLKLVQVINVALESLRLDRQRLIIVIALQLISIYNSSDNLPLEGIDNLVLWSHDGGFGCDLAVSKVVCMTILKDLLEFNKTLSRDENVVVLEKIRHVEPSWSLNSHIQQVSSRELEVIVIWVSSSEEAELVMLKGGDNSL